MAPKEEGGRGGLMHACAHQMHGAMLLLRARREIISTKMMKSLRICKILDFSLNFLS